MCGRHPQERTAVPNTRGLQQLTVRNSPITREAEDLTRGPTTEGTQRANGPRKRCSHPEPSGACKLKRHTSAAYPRRQAGALTPPDADADAQQRGLSCITGGTQNGTAARKTVRGFPHNHTIWQLCSPAFTQRNWKLHPHKNLHADGRSEQLCPQQPKGGRSRATLQQVMGKHSGARRTAER